MVTAKLKLGTKHWKLAYKKSETENKRLRVAIASILKHMDGNGMGDWPVAREARKVLN